MASILPLSEAVNRDCQSRQATASTPISLRIAAQASTDSIAWNDGTTPEPLHTGHVDPSTNSGQVCCSVSSTVDLPAPIAPVDDPGAAVLDDEPVPTVFDDFEPFDLPFVEPFDFATGGVAGGLGPYFGLLAAG